MRMASSGVKKIAYFFTVFLLLAIVNGLESIRTEDGDIFDCVDINKQPTMTHPLLKNHKVQMKPESFPESTKVDRPEKSEHVKLGLGKGCPVGTVPIRRTTKEDSIRARDFLRLYSNDVMAEEQTKWGRTIKCYGTDAYLNVYNPQVAGRDERSRMMLKLNFDPNPSLLSLAAGWAVFPEIYNDSSTRLHVSATVEWATECIDVLCPAFVQVSGNIALGMKISNVSTYHGKQYDIKLSIYKDPKLDCWWLLYGEMNEPIGYWPMDLFSEAASYAATASWGGEVASYDFKVMELPMGSGRKFEKSAEGGYGSACYIRGIKVQKTLGGELVDADGGELEKYDSPECYTVEGERISGSSGYTIFVGGSGGKDC